MAIERQNVAAHLAPLVERLLPNGLGVRMRFWDGSGLGPEGADGAIVLRSPLALRRLIYSRGELGFARAYVAGELDLEGDVYAALSIRDAFTPQVGGTELRIGVGERIAFLRAAARFGVIGANLPPPPEEIRLRGRLHTRRRDASAISHHYDISNDFYRLVLGETMAYSCAYFEEPDASLEDAQTAKYDLVCRKLGLSQGMRLLDVGCGWGSMAIHAAAEYGVTVVGITLSNEQADLARKRVAESGLSDRAEIRVQDYRDVSDGPFDAISSIGMFEHVGPARLGEYFVDLYGLLRDGGRLLNHAISRPEPASIKDPSVSSTTFMARYVFPDAALLEVGNLVSAMQERGLEVRDVESLREHYGLTLRRWVSNLEQGWDEAVRIVGEGRARVWRLYMAASAIEFEANRITVHQVLGVRTGARGESGMPPTRAAMLERAMRTMRAISSRS